MVGVYVLQSICTVAFDHSRVNTPELGAVSLHSSYNNNIRLHHKQVVSECSGVEWSVGVRRQISPAAATPITSTTTKTFAQTDGR